MEITILLVGGQVYNTFSGWLKQMTWEGGLVSESAILTCSKRCGIRKRYTLKYNLCAQALCASSYGQGQVKVEEYLEPCFNTVTIFLSLLYKVFLLWNDENFRMFLLFHVFSLPSCYFLIHRITEWLGLEGP